MIYCKFNTMHRVCPALSPFSVQFPALQEAIQGKLVPQDSNDEPASVILERIREEKLRLLKEGKLKKKDITDSASSKVTITSTTRKSAMRLSALMKRFRSIFRILGLGLDLQVLFASILKIKHQIIQLQHSFQWNK